MIQRKEGDYVFKEDLLKDFQTYKTIVKAFAEAGYIRFLVDVESEEELHQDYQDTLAEEDHINEIFYASDRGDFIGGCLNSHYASRRLFIEDFFPLDKPDWNEAPSWATVYLKNISDEGGRRDLYAWAEGHFRGAKFKREDIGVCSGLLPDCWEIISTRPPQQAKTGGLEISLKEAPKEPEKSWIEECEFPVVVISEEGRVVLATGRESDHSFSGTLLNNTYSHKAGRHSLVWAIRVFKPFNGEITIKNKGGQ